MTDTLAPLGVALTTGAPVGEVLDQVDLAIEHAVAAGDPDTLNELAATLDSIARQRDASWSGLAIAAARARAAAGQFDVDPGVRDVAPAPLPLAPARRPIAKPTTATPTVTNAGWWRRFGALSLDIIGLLIALSFVDSALGWTDDAGSIAYVLLWVGYFAGFYAFHGGATIGMTVLGVAVRNQDGESIGLGRATLRTLVLFTLLISGIGAVVDAIVAAVAPGRSLHDAIVRTIVIRVQ